MNITISINKIKGLLDQLQDSTDKIEVVYPKGTPESVLTLQKKNISKSADISEQILDEAQALTLFFVSKEEAVPEAPTEPEVTNDVVSDEPTTNEA
jgi:hypothetical protein